MKFTFTAKIERKVFFSTLQMYFHGEEKKNAPFIMFLVWKPFFTSFHLLYTQISVSTQNRF